MPGDKTFEFQIRHLADARFFLYNYYPNDINVVYDIGASDGYYSKIIKSAVDNEPKFYLFDADAKYANQENDFDFEFHNVVLSDTEKEVDYYSNGTGGDSYYREFTPLYDDIKPVKRQTVTLDKYRKEHNMPLPDLIKIDTQGSELDILAGGTECVANAKVIILECPLMEYNIGSPSFDDYINQMSHYGFVPRWLVEMHWLNKVMVQLDIAFVSEKGMR